MISISLEYAKQRCGAHAVEEITNDVCESKGPCPNREFLVVTDSELQAEEISTRTFNLDGNRDHFEHAHIQESPRIRREEKLLNF